VDPFHMESITAGGHCAVLRIDGDIDAYAAPQLRDRVTDLAGHGTVHIIADLRSAVSWTRPAWARWWAAATSFAPAAGRSPWWPAPARSCRSSG
jgi:hypothetical protein